MPLHHDPSPRAAGWPVALEPLPQANWAEHPQLIKGVKNDHQTFALGFSHDQ